MLLGYIILGTVWVEDLELRQKYEDYEKWLTTKENSGQVLTCLNLHQVLKWCLTLKENKFAKYKENKARYIEVFKFLFREVSLPFNSYFVQPYIESDYCIGFQEECQFTF